MRRTTKVEILTAEPKQLRARFLDLYVDRVPSRTLDVVAHMLFELDRPERVMNVGLGYLAESLAVGRVDVSFGVPSDRHLIPTGQVRRGGDWPSLIGALLPNRHRVVQQVWKRTDPVAFDDVASNSGLGSLQANFLESGARALLAHSLRSDQGHAFAIVCADDMEEGRVWSADQRATMAEFTRTFYGPILFLCRELSNARSHNKPSPAELEAVRLASCGYSYKEIAEQLGKSVRTIEFQLRQARRKTGANNQAELVLRCQPWL